LKFVFTVQPSAEVAVTVQLVAMVELTANSFGIAQVTWVRMPVVLTAMEPSKKLSVGNCVRDDLL
jgi:hypothetical protein